MKTYKIITTTKKILADTITPVSIYMKLRDIFPGAILLESSDYHSHANSYSFICLNSVASFRVDKGSIAIQYFSQPSVIRPVKSRSEVISGLSEFVQSFRCIGDEPPLIDGVFGYCAYDAVQYFEDIQLRHQQTETEYISAIRYDFYSYIIAINHFKNELQLICNQAEGRTDDLSVLEPLLANRSFATYPFEPQKDEQSNITDSEYIEMVKHGKEHCRRGDVFQIVLSRQFSRGFTGDDFNVYRSLRSINPSPYLYYFDYGTYRIFGSSPEAQIEVNKGKAYISPIAGTFRRTGDDERDKELAETLSRDPKENAEHIMLVDLARNDLGRTTTHVKVERYREIQFYSHVLHMVSKVSGDLPAGADTVRILAESFPAGTLSGAPKYKAMELIDKYENKSRGYYGGCIGVIRLNGDINHAIMIRSFMSKNNVLYYQAGAGIVVDSVEEKELQEVNNKLAALKTAIEKAGSNRPIN